MAELVCPKCQSPMRSFERSGLTVDQCTGCRGVFLDRGELERLVDAESAYYERYPAGRERHHDDDRYEQRRHESGGLSELGGLGGLLGGGHGRGGYGHGGYGHGGYGGGYKRKKHKRESFLSELFD